MKKNMFCCILAIRGSGERSLLVYFTGHQWAVMMEVIIIEGGELPLETMLIIQAKIRIITTSMSPDIYRALSDITVREDR